EAVDLRQHDIQQNEAAEFSRQPFQSLAPVRDEVDLVAFRAQVLDDPRAEMRIILHDEDAARGLGRSGHDCSRRAGWVSSGWRLPVASAARSRCASPAGQASTNVAPWPTPALCALTRPPASCIRRLTM